MASNVIGVELGESYVATIQLQRPPNNFFSNEMVGAVASALEELDGDPGCRAVVLCAEGKHFCAGADLSGGEDAGGIYEAAVRLFRTQTPVVAAIQGAAVGGGLGLALAADFRIAAPEARFSANFARLGFHQGFGVSVTLPRLVGEQAAAELLFTGRRVKGEEAVALGLADRLAGRADLHAAAHGFAEEIAASAPLAVQSIRATLRGDLADRIELAVAHELAEQTRLRETADFAEGIRAMAERRSPLFKGE